MVRYSNVEALVDSWRARFQRKRYGCPYGGGCNGDGEDIDKGNTKGLLS